MVARKVVKKTKAKAKPTPSKAKSKTKAGAKPKPKTKAKVKPKTKATVKPKTKATVKRTAKATVKPKTKATVKPKTKATVKRTAKTSRYFKGFDFTGFWDDDAYARKAYISPAPSDALIASVEAELGYKLPAAYVTLMKLHNGGVPHHVCFPAEGPTGWAHDHVALTGIFGIGRDKDCSLAGGLGSKFMMQEWGYPDIGVYFADCPSAGHDMIAFDYREAGPTGEPRVVYVNQENDFHITHLAADFESFIRGLVSEEAFED